MSQSENEAWHHETAKILEEIDCLKRAEARHYTALGKRIDELCADLRVHKVKTGFVAGITTALAIIAAWMLSLLRGG